MKNTTYTTADQATTTLALSDLKAFAAEIFAHRAHGKYAIDNALKASARNVIIAALDYCAELGAEIGDETQLGCCGTPVEWANEFRSDLSRIL
tara:strand:+ start:16072 stop:16350 length:279 start_codon:yes stop_codon:yes gene_type:complete